MDLEGFEAEPGPVTVGPPQEEQALTLLNPMALSSTLESIPRNYSMHESETFYLIEKLFRSLGQPFQHTLTALQHDLVSF